VTLAADTFYYFGVELRDTQARAHVLDANGRRLETSGWMDLAVSADVLLTPWAFQQNRSGAAHTMTIDALFVYQRRTAS
jgi:hypothetical protein